jgi:hypothetical protein
VNNTNHDMKTRFRVTFDFVHERTQIVLDFGAKYGGTQDNNSFAFESYADAQKFMFAIRDWGVECSSPMAEYT